MSRQVDNLGIDGQPDLQTHSSFQNTLSKCPAVSMRPVSKANGYL